MGTPEKIRTGVRVLFFLLLSFPSLCRGQEMVLSHNGFTLSYNCGHNTAGWVSWMLTKSHVTDGDEPRSPAFFADPLVPYAYRVTPSDYTDSGYDRGHLCPAADMAYSQASMHDCFYMSNMCPQNPQLNRISWKALENACRKWVMKEDTLYIVAGPVYKGSNPKRIGRSHSVDVPDGFFKVVLSLREGHRKAIGFYYSNDSGRQDVQSTAATVDDIERLTGIDFFRQLDDTLEELLESRCSLGDWEQ